MSTGKIHIGTSGWQYDHWTDSFYPGDLKDDEKLDFYAERLNSVEVNNSFYNLPEKKTVENWRETVPGDFIFSVKASRYITHMKKLNDPEESTDRFLSRVEELGDKLGPVLFQLPPNWKVNRKRLSEFLSLLPEHIRPVIEFREESWFDDEIYEILRDANAAMCVYDLERNKTPNELTADFVYIRLHGPEEEAYRGKYDKQALSGWAGAISTWQGKGLDVFCYFNNDDSGYAAENALELREMTGA